MTVILIAALLVIWTAYTFGWRAGWNKACERYRDMDVEKAEARYERDRI